MATSTTVQIARDSGFEQLVYTKELEEGIKSVDINYKTDNVPYGVQLHTRLRYNNDDGGCSNDGHSEWSTTVKFQLKIPYQVIGVCIDPGSKTVYWIDEVGNQLSSFDYTEHPTYRAIAMVTEDASRSPVTMTQIPLFYIRTSANGLAGSFSNGKPSWWISDMPVAGFRPHPAFKRSSGGTLSPNIKVATYMGHSESVGGRSCVGSIKGRTVYVGTTKSTMMSMCTNRNDSGAGQSGWRSYDIYDHAALQILGLIAKGSTDTQRSYGDSSGSSSPATGSTTGRLLFSGTISEPTVWLDDMWRCYWTHVDRISLASNLYAIRSPIDNSNISLSTSYRRPTSSGWVDTVWDGHFTLGEDTHDLMELFLPKSTAGSESLAAFKDYYEYTNNCGDMKVGGHWGNGSQAGLFAITDRGDTYTTTSGGNTTYQFCCHGNNGHGWHCGYGYYYTGYYHTGGNVYYHSSSSNSPDYLTSSSDRADIRHQPAYNTSGMCPYANWTSGSYRDDAPCVGGDGHGTYCGYYKANYVAAGSSSSNGVFAGSYGHWNSSTTDVVTTTHYYNYIAARLAKS